MLPLMPPVGQRGKLGLTSQKYGPRADTVLHYTNNGVDGKYILIYRNLAKVTLNKMNMTMEITMVTS